MAKKLFGRILPILMVLCIVLSTAAMAATTYYIDVTLSGPDAEGVVRKIEVRSSKYGALSSPLAEEVVQVLYTQIDTIETVYSLTGLRNTVYDGMTAFTEGEAAWDTYVDTHHDNVDGDFKDILRSMDSTFADLNLNETNKISFLSHNDTTYVVTVTLRQYRSGMKHEEENKEEMAVCLSAAFADLDLRAWYHEGICYCLSRGIMDGYSKTHFGPNDTLTRAQVAQVLYNMENKPAVSAKQIFSDVAASDWYANAITWASKAGVVQGLGGGKFAPNDSITREQLAAMLYRYSDYKGYSTEAGKVANLDRFTDANQVSAWALEAVKWACADEIMGGMGAGVLNPAGCATRAQAAAMFMRYCVNFAE